MNWLRFKQCLVTLGDLGLVSPLPIIADKPLDLTVPGGAVLLPPLADDAGFGIDGGTISATGAPTHEPHASRPGLQLGKLVWLKWMFRQNQEL